MVELIILLLGIIASIGMALAKLVFDIEAYTYLACLVPLFIAVLLSLAMNGIDLFD